MLRSNEAGRSRTSSIGGFMAKHAMTSSGLPAFTSHSFARTPNISKPRSTMDRSKVHKTTINAGFWTPVYLDEVLPGDTMKLDASLFARLLSPLSVPIMDNMYMDWIAIYCPNRLLWTHFVNQMGEQENPTDTIDYLTPVVTVPEGGFTSGSLADYFGIPIAVGGSDAALPATVSALPFRMYNLFHLQWVYAQNIMDSPPINNGDGPDPASDYVLLNRMRRPDYFTSCQPATQKGSPVEISLAGTAPIISDGTPIYFNDGAVAGHTGQIQITPSAHTTEDVSGTITSATPLYYGNGWMGDTGLETNLAGTSLLTINDLRLLITTQQYLEMDERGGTRFPEFLKNHFGVTSSDARLQRVEFLGAGTIPIMTHLVPQTSQSDTTAQANLAAFTSASGRCGFHHSFEEHGHVMVLVEIRSDLTYQQGLHRMWSRQTRYDYYDPMFANIGEQAVLNQEIALLGEDSDSEPFGYQEYAAEYRFGFSQVTGLMREGVANSVAVYNLALNFGAMPVLNPSFMQDDPPISRIIAVEDQPQFIFDSNFRVTHTRVMPMFSVPGLHRV